MNVANRFFRSAVTFAVLGLSLGLFMALSHDHSQMPTHVHLLMIGWVSMFLFGAFYALVPAAAGTLAAVHWWLVNIGVLIMIPGLYTLLAGHPEIGGPATLIGAFIVFAGMLVFAFVVYRHTASARTGTSRPGRAVPAASGA